MGIPKIYKKAKKVAESCKKHKIFGKVTCVLLGVGSFQLFCFSTGHK